jgi:hypothetical protein
MAPTTSPKRNSNMMPPILRGPRDPLVAIGAGREETGATTGARTGVATGIAMGDAVVFRVGADAMGSTDGSVIDVMTGAAVGTDKGVGAVAGSEGETGAIAPLQLPTVKVPLVTFLVSKRFKNTNGPTKPVPLQLLSMADASMFVQSAVKQFPPVKKSASGITHELHATPLYSIVHGASDKGIGTVSKSTIKQIFPTELPMKVTQLEKIKVAFAMEDRVSKLPARISDNERLPILFDVLDSALVSNIPQTSFKQVSHSLMHWYCDMEYKLPKSVLT